MNILFWSKQVIMKEVKGAKEEDKTPPAWFTSYMEKVKKIPKNTISLLWWMNWANDVDYKPQKHYQWSLLSSPLFSSPLLSSLPV